MQLYVLPGDGIGPEIVGATVRVLKHLDAQEALGLRFDQDEVGFPALKEHGSTFPQHVIDKFPTFDGVLLGPNDGAAYPPKAEGGINYSAFTRTTFDLYANIRPARTPPGLETAGKPMDLVIVREVTEGHYADRNMFEGHGEVMPDPDMVISLRKVTRHACERICRRAFELAMSRRRKVTMVHKANVLRLGDGLFLESARKVAEAFPDVVLDDVLVDAMAAHLVRTPDRFDVVVTGNMYGDILSDLASELSGSLGLSGAIMSNDDLCVAQAQHGAAPDIAGRDVANPTSMLLSAAMLLEWLGGRHARQELTAAGARIRTAVDHVIANPQTRTPDLGGSLGTVAFTDAVIDALRG